MSNTVQVTLVLEPEDAAKLVELAGGVSNSVDYIVRLIRLHYEEKQVLGEKADLFPVMGEIQVLLDTHKQLEEQLVLLAKRLHAIPLKRDTS